MFGVDMRKGTFVASWRQSIFVAAGETPAFPEVDVKQTLCPSG